MGAMENIDFLLAAANKSFDKFAPDVIAQYIQRGFIEKDGESFKPLCPVMTERQYEKLQEDCIDSINEIASLLAEIVSVSTRIMENHAPVSVKAHCEPLAATAFNGMAEIMENLCASGYLKIPQKYTFLTIFSVI